jgi:hypothetical protein
MTDDAAIFAITLCYAALGTAVLMIVVRLVSRKLPAMLAILVLTCFYFVVFFSLQGLRGWSAPVAVPDRFQVLWTRVIEPNAVLNRRGATHLWLEELDEQNLPSGEPRVYVLPYSTALAYNVATAQVEIKKRPCASWAGTTVWWSPRRSTTGGPHRSDGDSGSFPWWRSFRWWVT